jgi:hypothetical protein
MGSRSIEGGDGGIEHPLELLLMEDQQVVEAFLYGLLSLRRDCPRHIVAKQPNDMCVDEFQMKEPWLRRISQFSFDMCMKCESMSSCVRSALGIPRGFLCLKRGHDDASSRPGHS